MSYLPHFDHDDIIVYYITSFPPRPKVFNHYTQLVSVAPSNGGTNGILQGTEIVSAHLTKIGHFHLEYVYHQVPLRTKSEQTTPLAAHPGLNAATYGHCRLPLFYIGSNRK